MSTPDSSLPAVLRPLVLPRPRRETPLSKLAAAIERLPATIVASAGLLLIVTISVVSGRLLAVNLAYDLYVDSTPIATGLGAVGFLSGLVVYAAIVLGRHGLAHTKRTDTWDRQVATITLGAGYLHMIFWGTRVAAGLIAVASTGSVSQFLPNMFWWG